HAVCRNDKGCDLNPLPGTPSYSLTNLEQEAQDYLTLGAWQMFLNEVWEPIWNVLTIYATIGGCITLT
ncbi:hypothetical protein, partial [Klebsiella aerogenes]|uniref:hypothetical protein n=1 Tax=Klebsiella aerogenes TaxID=548 RepID=UPI001CC77530